MKIKIFAPVSGEIKNIKYLNDDVFSNEMLGPGFFIIPKEKKIGPPFENCAITDIFETKHAFSVKTNDVVLLTHIGLETVNLKGLPFKYKKNINDNVNSKDTILEVDFEAIPSSYNKSVCVTVVNFNELNELKFNLIANGDVEKGELVAEVSYKPSTSPAIYKNRYENMAENIYYAIGTENNYTNVYNCITRLRFSIIDKSKVDTQKIKNVKNVQGVVWAANELQVVIGADVVKAKEAYIKYVENKNNPSTHANNTNFILAFKKGISGVMTLLIPYLIASGMLYALFTVLGNLGLVESLWLDYTDPTNIRFLNEYDIWTGVFYIICTSGLMFMAFAFSHCTVKFLGGNTVIGSLIGISLLGIPLFGGLEWVMFRIGEVDIKVQGYTNLVIPQVVAAIFYVYFDKWLKKIIPNVVDLVLRHLIAVFTTVTLTFFVMGPAMGLVEFMFHYVIKAVDGIPFGISVAIFSTLAPCLTVLGVAWAVGAPIQASIASGTPNAMWCAWYLGEFAMAFSTLAVAFKTKNKNTRRLALNAGITGIFGISEPALYTILLPRQKTFLCAIFSAGTAGLIVGILGLKVYSTGGGGLFFFTQFISGGLKPVLLAILGLGISSTLSFISTYFLFTEKVNPKKEIAKNANSIKKILENKKLEMSPQKELLIEKLKFLNEIIDDKWIEQNKMMEDILNSRISTEVKLIAVRDKIEKLNEKIYKKFQKKNYLEEKKRIFEKPRNILLLDKERVLEHKLEKINFESNEIAKFFDKKNNMLLQQIERFLLEMDLALKTNEFINLVPKFSNILFNTQIFYEFILPKHESFNRKIAILKMKEVKNEI